jgi:hypothetical protein
MSLPQAAIESSTQEQTSSMPESSSASTRSNRQLKPNPFTTYRDPETGKWLVIKPAS